MKRFTYDDVVQVLSGAPSNFRPGEKAWIVAILEDRERFPLNEFPAGTIYTVEFKDGSAINIHSDYLVQTEEGE
jgi:hypothetical protein